MEKIKYILDGLDCAHCAEKIADKIRKLDGVDSANINFAAKTLSVTYSGDIADLEPEFIKAVHSLEPDVTVSKKGGNTISASDNAHSHEHCQNEHCHTHSHGHHHSENELSLRKIIITLCGVALFLLTYIPNMPTVLNLILAYAGYILAAHDIIISVAKRLKSFDIFDENFLMLVASFGAMLVGEYLEAFAVIVFYQIGEFCQDIAVSRSRRSISSLMDIRPDTARVLLGGEEKTVSPQEVSVGDIIIINPGEKIPLDGECVFGESVVDTSAITGEAVPCEVSAGDSVLSGCINKSGVIRVRVSREFAQSTVSRILDLVENSSEKKAKSENFITKFARVYTPAVVGAALLLGVIGSLVTGDVSTWVYRSLTFLVVSCPCALVLSIPLSYFSAIGAGARHGILIKGGNYLEAINSAGTVLFDKTGTLTTGRFLIDKIIAENGYDERQVLALAAIAESSSTHPIAKSILAANKISFDKSKIEKYSEKSSFGVTAVYDGNTIIAGSDKIMKQEGISAKTVGSAAVHIAVNGNYAGCILLKDDIKPDAKQTVNDLRDCGISKIVMLTGDNEGAANAVADTLGIDCHFGLLPQDKVEYVEKYKKDGKTVFVGDGMNDAPVLSSADIGFAMGGVGSDSAIEAADIVLMNDKPSLVVKAIKIAKRTRIIVTENIVFVLGVKLLVLLLSALGIAHMWAAVFADVGVALIAVLNAVRLIGMKY